MHTLLDNGLLWRTRAPHTYTAGRPPIGSGPACLKAPCTQIRLGRPAPDLKGSRVCSRQGGGWGCLHTKRRLTAAATASPRA